MSGKHPKKLLDNGELNPKWKPRASGPNSGKRPKKLLEDGTPNPAWKPHKSGQHKPGRKHSGSPQKSKFERALFIAWDGEGKNTGHMIDEGTREHIYTLLGYKKRKGKNEWEGDYIYNEKGLTSEQCFELVCNTAKKYTRAIHVIYGGSYDMNMFLRTIPIHILKLIADENKGVWWKQYSITYVQRKYLMISRFRDQNRKFGVDKNGKLKPDYDVTVVLWDVIGFFQGTFAKTLKSWLGADYPDLLLIEEGKSLRKEFDNVDLNFILKYNDAELRALVVLMEKLQEALKKVGLDLRRWDGAGAVAAAMCRKHNVSDAFRHKEGKVWVRDELPPQVQEAAQYAYFGGRIEQGKYGVHIIYEQRKIKLSTIHHYDINSAYPAAQWDLPALNRGYWRKVEAKEINMNTIGKYKDFPPFVVFHVKWHFDYEIFCPFPYRAQTLQRKILYPEVGEGWYWYPEVKAAFEWYISNPQKHNKKWHLEIIEAWEFVPYEDCYKPYVWMKDYYNERQYLIQDTKQTGALHGEEKVLKLGPNSVYGKTAQHAGYNPGSFKLPPYHNLAYAGYITSKTRAKMWEAAIQKPEAIICLATDGIFSTEPLDLDISETKELGKWEYSKHDGMILLMSGFYWIYEKGKWSGWSRGFDKVVGEGTTKEEREKDYQDKMIEQIEEVKKAWQQGKQLVYFPCTRFITIKSGMKNEKWQKRWCNWFKIGADDGVPGRVCKIHPNGTKRTVYPSEEKGKKPWLEMVQTRPEENYNGIALGDMYILPWDEDFKELEEQLDGIPQKVAVEEQYIAMEELGIDYD